MTFWDVAAGILVGGGLIMGMVWGAKRSGAEQPFFWICGGLACFVILWRGYVWHETGDAAALRADKVAGDLYAKYDLALPDHQ